MVEAADRKVEQALVEQVMDLVAADRTSQQPHAGGAAPQRCREIGHDQQFQLAREAQPKSPVLRGGVEMLLQPQRLLHALQRLADTGRQHLRPGGRVHGRARSNQQIVVEQQPQRGEAMAHRGLLHAQPRGRTRDATLLHEGVEGHQEVQVERPQIEVINGRHASDRLDCCDDEA